MHDFEGDASLVLAALNLGEAADSSLGHAINDDRHFVRSFSRIRLSDVRWEANKANKVAHGLARSGLALEQVTWFEEPHVIIDLLFEDSNFM